MSINAENFVAQLLAQAKQHSTPLGAGVLQWQCWSGPVGARPLLLLHGGFGSWTHWAANIAALRQNRPIWSLDIPGLGVSAALPGDPDSTDFAAAIMASLNTLHGIDVEFDIAGFSFGALIGADLAVLAQDRCSHFIACGAAGFGDLHVQVDLLRPPGPDVPVAQAQAIHRINLARLMLHHEQAIDEMAVNIHSRNLAQARFNSRRLAKSDGFIQALPDIRARLCGVWGTEDATAGGVLAIEQRQMLFQQAQPDSGFHILEGVGHWAMYEDVPAFNAIVESATRC
ncbi:MAG: alpha/beta fold hydrolase [Halioglobus sp.]